MKLITEAQSKQLQAQYTKEDTLGQKVLVKLFDPMSSWSWYLMNQDPEDPDYLWGIADGFEVEMGSISLSELEDIGKSRMLGIERDLHFRPMLARDLMAGLIAGKHF